MVVLSGLLAVVTLDSAYGQQLTWSVTPSDQLNLIEGGAAINQKWDLFNNTGAAVDLMILNGTLTSSWTGDVDDAPTLTLGPITPAPGSHGGDTYSIVPAGGHWIVNFTIDPNRQDSIPEDNDSGTLLVQLQ